MGNSLCLWSTLHAPELGFSGALGRNCTCDARFRIAGNGSHRCVPVAICPGQLPDSVHRVPPDQGGVSGKMGQRMGLIEIGSPAKPTLGDAEDARGSRDDLGGLSVRYTGQVAGIASFDGPRVQEQQVDRTSSRQASRCLILRADHPPPITPLQRRRNHHLSPVRGALGISCVRGTSGSSGLLPTRTASGSFAGSTVTQQIPGTGRIARANGGAVRAGCDSLL
jgi:hypothetical protein